MTLGIFLALGDSFKNMNRTGQANQFKKFYLSHFSKSFSKVYIFSYDKEKVDGLPENIEVIPNKYKLHRYIYGLILPFLNFTYIRKCDVFRVYHLLGSLPAIVTRLFFLKPFIFNYAYNYSQFAIIENKKIQSLLVHFLKPLSLIFASRVFVANRSLLRKLNSTKLLYLPNGVDINFFKPKGRKEKKKVLILSVGRLEKQKNYESLIEALSKIKADLLLIGRGTLRSKLMSLSHKRSVNLQIIEKLDNTQMPKIYNKADIFILPSLAEGHPKVLLEAMACGLAVIGTKVSGIIDIIQNGKNGLLISHNLKDITLAIRKLIANKKLRLKLAKNARRYVETNYNLSMLLSREINALKATIR